jgi:small-conductance mechanosensitive channel
MLDGQELFKIQVPVAGYPPETRAMATTNRLRRIARNPNIDPKELSVVHDDLSETSNITYGGEVLVYVTEADARAAQTSRRALAYQAQQRIQDAIAAYREARQPERILRGVLTSLLLTLGLCIFFWLILKISELGRHYLERWKGYYIPPVRILNTELLSAERVTDVIWEVFKLIRLGLLLLVLFVYISQVLRSLPWTRPAGERLFDYLSGAATTLWQHFVDYLPNLFFIGLIALSTHYLLRIIRFFFTELERNRLRFPGFFPQWAKPTYNIVRVLVLLFAVTIAFPYLPGSDSPAFQGISLFVGALFTLGSSGAIANLISGVVLIYSRAYEKGDRVKISDAVGDVIDKSLMVTRLRTPKNVIITIPNYMVLSSHIVNYSATIEENQNPLIIHTTITLGYDVPWRKVHEVLIQAANKTDKILKVPPPFVLQTSLDDFYVSYELNAYTNHPEAMPQIFSELHQNMQDGCNDNQIEILSPHYAAMRDGNQLAVPEKYWPPDYTPPAFRVNANTQPPQS